MTDSSLRTRLTDLIYGTVSWRDVNVPVAEEVADAVIRELDEVAETITDAVETALFKHDFHASSSKCSCGAVNNMDGDVLHLHRISLIGAAVRGVLGGDDA